LEEGAAMISIQAHFDGRVIVPEEPIDLPQHEIFMVRIERSNEPEDSPSALAWLAKQEVEDNLPADLSRQHDHYLYGAAKRK
jgi:hypothetical protein